MQDKENILNMLVIKIYKSLRRRKVVWTENEMSVLNSCLFIHENLEKYTIRVLIILFIKENVKKSKYYPKGRSRLWKMKLKPLYCLSVNWPTIYIGSIKIDNSKKQSRYKIPRK